MLHLRENPSTARSTRTRLTQKDVQQLIAPRQAACTFAEYTRISGVGILIAASELPSLFHMRVITTS